VVTGYVCNDKSGSITTLGRGGSDFTATILGRLLDAREIWIYTDVNGILTADPKIVREAKTIEKLSFREVRELSYFGAKVMHSKSLIPAMEGNIPIRVKNTFNPEGPHTLISAESASFNAKAITSIKDVALVSILGLGMQGLKGISKRVFETASKSNFNVVMIAQSSSEQNIDIFVRESDSEKFVTALKYEFENEMKLKLIDMVSVRKNLSVISIVGENLNNIQNVKKEIFRITYSYNINVISVVQGSSLDSISFAVKRSDLQKTIRALHTELGLIGHKLKTINIFQFGVGGVGKALIELTSENSKITEELGIKIDYLGLARSSSFATSEEVKEHIDKMDFGFKHSGSPLNYIKTLPRNTVILDLTNSTEIANDLLELLSLGYYVVTSNKKNLAADFDAFQKFTKNNRQFLFEATVGASLPIIKTIKDYLRTGDVVEKIIMLPSGTLSFIFTLFNTGVDLKTAINKAIEFGYTEPNPIEDLVGMDLLRKGKIIAYLIGKNFDSSQIEFECFTKAKNIEEFFENDFERFLKKVEKLSRIGLVYPVVEISDKLKIHLTAFGKDSSFGSLREGENVFEIYLRNFSGMPVTIKGLGAGYRV
ncbi:MAG: aspartate kinase, partial [Caldisericaceae bacterium]